MDIYSAPEDYHTTSHTCDNIALRNSKKNLTKDTDDTPLPLDLYEKRIKHINNLLDNMLKIEFDLRFVVINKYCFEI